MVELEEKVEGGSSGSFFKKNPVSAGDVVEAKCISIGKKGDGIFKVAGYVIVVPDTKLNQTYSIRIIKALPRVAFGKVEEVKEPTSRI